MKNYQKYSPFLSIIQKYICFYDTVPGLCNSFKKLPLTLRSKEWLSAVSYILRGVNLEKLDELGEIFIEIEKFEPITPWPRQTRIMKKQVENLVCLYLQNRYGKVTWLLAIWYCEELDSAQYDTAQRFEKILISRRRRNQFNPLVSGPGQFEWWKKLGVENLSGLSLKRKHLGCRNQTSEVYTVKKSFSGFHCLWLMTLLQSSVWRKVSSNRGKWVDYCTCKCIKTWTQWRDSEGRKSGVAQFKEQCQEIFDLFCLKDSTCAPCELAKMVSRTFSILRRDSRKTCVSVVVDYADTGKLFFFGKRKILTKKLTKI